VEPDKADCIFRSAQADDGKLRFVTGDMDSMMAGLCCGEPCTISWEILDSYADAFLSCGDHYSAQGMRLLGRAEGEDTPVISGESGAVGAGVLQAIMQEERLAELREQLGLDENSRVLLISTEGDTDRENYRRILAQE
jgi:diaminopropionate ammonia-lyase